MKKIEKYHRRNMGVKKLKQVIQSFQDGLSNLQAPRQT